MKESAYSRPDWRTRQVFLQRGYECLEFWFRAWAIAIAELKSDSIMVSKLQEWSEPLFGIIEVLGIPKGIKRGFCINSKLCHKCFSSKLLIQ
jgi:hypothetical protein